MRKYDPQQQIILDALQQRQLVSASAGSGKTTVMIQKITNLLLSHKVDISSLLVVTFTDLASTEMKERLIKNLQDAIDSCTDENEITNLINIKSSIDTARIDTIDGFCSKMIKKYFYQLNLEPTINIISNISKEYYVAKALDKTISYYNKEKKEELLYLTDIFEKQSRNLDNLKENLIKTFNFISTQEDPQEFLDSSLNEYLSLNSKSANFLNNYLVFFVKEKLSYLKIEIEYLKDYKERYTMLKNYVSALEKISDKNSILENYKIIEALPIVSFNKGARPKDEDKITEQNISAKVKALKELFDKISFLSVIDNPNHLPIITKHLQSFIGMLKTYINFYSEIKVKNNVMDFADLERIMLTLLNNQEIKKELQETFKYIFVDEYQDINPMQNQIITLLTANQTNVFFVGDIKQSIYGFRQSTPDMFLDTYNQFKNNSALGTAFDMNINFRSNPEILNFNNEVFDSLMTKIKADIDYKENGRFVPKRDDFVNFSKPVKIIAIDSNAFAKKEFNQDTLYSVKDHKIEKNYLDTDAEIFAVVNEIQNLVGSEIYDSNIKKTRIVNYSDIAILSRGINNDAVNNLIACLKENNIPINIKNKTNLKETESVNLIYNILRVIANRADDVAYTSFFQTMANMSFEEFLIISKQGQKTMYENLQSYIANTLDNLAVKIKNGFNLIYELRLNYSVLTNAELIQMILDKYHLRQNIMTYPNGIKELSFLEEFISSISQKENSLPLSEFISIVESNFANENDIELKDDVNSITIQTIHASKGLEYPVVILFNTAQRFRYLTNNDELKFDTNLGIGMQYYDLTLREKSESITRFAIDLKNKLRGYKEELRLLYVAMTRAKNNLIITGITNREDLENGNLKTDNYFDLILSVFRNKIITEDLKDDYVFQNEEIIFKNLVDVLNKKSLDKFSSYNFNEQELNGIFNFQYPYEYTKDISIKNNVTAITKQINEEYNILPSKLKIVENLHKDSEELTSIGTLYHQVLFNIDFNNFNLDFKYKDIDYSLIEKAYKTIKPLMTDGAKISKEAKFMMYLPYDEIYPDALSKDKVLVQGVVDLMIEREDGFILIDYKYSSLDINTLKEKYKTQLRLYSLAIEKAYKKKILGAYIYSIKTGDMK